MRTARSEFLGVVQPPWACAGTALRIAAGRILLELYDGANYIRVQNFFELFAAQFCRSECLHHRSRFVISTIIDSTGELLAFDRQLETNSKLTTRYSEKSLCCSATP